ncbi:Flp family type IVb pilin [Erythrobacter sanguineus]|jgi:pilus assembly protein Flp/PilA|uniref:Pilus assembly protein Flp/PilA n=1 Tax=Erythrobacter sanguineus TaxID=198312 RepID=A0A1M7RUL4_9SPHN|nr:Flp family type IVb pilin [Erythrobacter sanguineus]SHN49900.1 pilus assembly protein Flp/PilA [Erythrobacter sanguineus]
MKMKTFLWTVKDDSSGATAVEYGLILSLVVIAIVSMLQAVAGATIEMWDTVETEIVEATSN